MPTKLISFLFAVALMCAGPTCASAQQQDTGPTNLDKAVQTRVTNINAHSGTFDRAQAVTLDASSVVVAYVIAGKLKQPDLRVAIDEARMDEQVGAPPSSSGTTNLVSKAAIPLALGLAVENGALTRSDSGTTVTFEGNPIGIFEALSKAGFTEAYRENEGDPANILRRVSFGLTFDTSRGDHMGMFTGDTQQLSSWNVRVELINRRDPRDPFYGKSWSGLMEVKGVNMAELGAAMFRTFATDPELQAWEVRAKERVGNAAPDRTEAVLRETLDEIDVSKLRGETIATVKTFVTAFDDFLADRDAILALAAHGPLLTFEYTNMRDPATPDTSNFRLIGETSFMRGKAELTGNASVTVLNSLPTDVHLKRVRDFQAATQLDIPIAQSARFGNFVLSFSGRYERKFDDAFMNGMIVPNTKGDLAVGQIKLTIPIKGTGMKIPLSVSFANRTDLIMEREVRGNVGFTLDLDSLFLRK